MLDAGGGGGVPSMSGLKEAALAGAFTVNETGGKAMLAAIRDMAAWVDDNMADLNTTHRALPLGRSNGANLMKPYMQQVFTDDQGFVTRLKEFRASLVDAEAAITEAMRQYGTTESDITGTFRAV
ncbi:hypothetical protein CLV71_12465 [Actinophytocola oryzae]|uniref:Uncharacterized protein n=2 Tax=Actinophytocola oryzae TaxID=502181 RepID=A0A4R7UTQ3_9PSEU|nr:hypothetical protein CLV71_12465 [Actinophytocola oryzae]